MRTYVISASGDNDRLHEIALKAAVEAIESVNHSPVRNARIESDHGSTIVVRIGEGIATVDPQRLAAKLRYSIEQGSV